jgi:hypothetical protein
MLATVRRKLYSVWLNPSQIAGLKKVRERDGVLPSEQIRRAIDAWLARKGIRHKQPTRVKGGR